MKRTTLLGSVAAGLLAASAAAPAWAQATTYPEGTDCAAIGNSASRTECMNQMDESRQNPISGNQGDAPAATGTGTNVAPGSTNPAPGGTLGAPSNSNAPNGPQDGTTGNPSAGSTTGPANNGAATQ
jgi:hypothetical protein